MSDGPNTGEIPLPDTFPTFPVDQIAPESLPPDLHDVRCVGIDDIIRGNSSVPFTVIGAGISGLGLQCTVDRDISFLKLFMDSPVPPDVLEKFISSHFDTGMRENAHGILSPTPANLALSMIRRRPLEDRDNLGLSVLRHAEALAFVHKYCDDLGYVVPRVQSLTTYAHKPCGIIMDFIKGTPTSPYSDRQAMRTMRALEERGVRIDLEGQNNVIRDENGRFVFLDFVLDQELAEEWKKSRSS
jgi:hypothetical protein